MAEAASNGANDLAQLYSVPIMTFGDEKSKEYFFQECFPSDIIARDGEIYCKRKFEELLRALSHPPVYSTLRVNTRKYRTDDIREAVEEYLRENEPYHHFMVRCHRNLPDVIVVECATQPDDNLQPCSKREVIVDTSCGSAILRGANIYGRGVIGLLRDTSMGDRVSVFVDLTGQCRRGYRDVYEGEKVFIANGIMKTSRQELFEGFQNASGLAVEISETFINNPSLNNILQGKVFVQNLPSIVCGHVLDPQPGDMVLDMCAAPGGKTTHIACLMKDDGRVFALDKAKKKVRKIKDNARHMGLTCIKAFNLDASNAISGSESLPLNPGKPPYRPGSFDRVLLDAPCSGTGQRAQIKCKHSKKFLSSFPNFQKSLFHTAMEALKPGGTLVYSTCSMTTSENEAIVSWALSKFPGLKLAEQTPHIGSTGLVCCGLSEEQASKLQRFWPSSRLAGDENADCNKDTIGFFIAKFVK